MPPWNGQVEAFPGQPDEVETHGFGCAAQAHAAVADAIGHRRGDGQVRHLLVVVAGDFGWRDIALLQEIVEQDACAGAPLPIDVTRAAQVGDALDVQRIAGGQNQPLFALSEGHQRNRLIAQIALQVGRVVAGGFRIKEVAAGHMRLPPPQRHQAADGADIDRDQPRRRRAQAQARRQQIQHGIVAAHDH